MVQRLTTWGDLRRITSRHAGRPGARELHAVLHDSDCALTRSEAEEAFLALIRRGRVEPPQCNVLIVGHEVDFVWPRSRLVVEIDGFVFHSSRRAFERDRRRDADLIAVGFRVMRVTWRQIQIQPEAVLVRLVRALAAAPSTLAQQRPTPLP